MTANAAKIEHEFEGLAREDLIALHEQLINKIQEAADAKGLEPSFRSKLERRIEEIESGATIGADAFQALKEMYAGSNQA